MAKNNDKQKIADNIRVMNPEQWDEMRHHIKDTRLAGLMVLGRLAKAGVDDAQTVKGMLLNKRPKDHILPPTLDEVALELNDRQTASADINEQRRFKTLGSLAHAAGALALVQVARQSATDSSELTVLTTNAQRQVLGADVPEPVRTALTDILNEFK
jgi:hypothetical protein